MGKRIVLAALVSALVCACADPTDESTEAGQSTEVGEPTGSADTTGTESAPDARVALERTGFDFATLAQNTRLAYHPVDDGVFAAHLETYSARVDAHRLEVRARGFVAGAHPDEPAITGSAGATHASAPLRLETTRIQRGRTALLSGSEVRHGAEGHVEILRGAVVERIENGDGGVEQSWRFDRAPAGTGELEVELRASGLRFVAATDSGLHFAGSDGLGMRYGHATWIDARGQRTAVPARWDGERIRLRVPDRALRASTYPAVLDPVIGPEFDVDVPVTRSRGATTPAVAASDHQFLVVWQNSGGVFGARVATDGTLLDLHGFAVRLGSPSSDTRVASDGTDFFVVWAESQDVHGARVTAAGEVLDTAPIAVSDAAGAQGRPAVAYDGTNYVVVYEDTRATAYPNARIYGTRVAPNGAVLDPSGLLVSGLTGRRDSAVIARVGDGSLVAWSESVSGSGQVIRATGISPDGTVATPGGALVSEDTRGRPALASDGTRAMVAWAGTASGTLLGRRVEADGSPLDTEDIGIASGSGSVTEPAATFDGESFLVAWSDGRNGGLGLQTDLYAARVSTSMTAGAAFPVVSRTGIQKAAALATADGVVLATWYDGRPRPEQPGGYAARIEAAGTIAEPGGFLVTPRLVEQTRPDIASDGSDFLVVWSDARIVNTFGASIESVYGARVSASGAAYDPAGFLIATGEFHMREPAVGFGGANYFVAWRDERNGAANWDIYGARVSPAGVVLDPAGIPVTVAGGHQFTPDVAATATTTLVVWTDRRQSVSQVWGARLDAGGTLLDVDGIQIGTRMVGQSLPGVASDGDDFLVVWREEDLAGARMRASGELVDTPALSLSGCSGQPGVAYGGGTYLVSWSCGLGLLATRVAPDGTIATPGGQGLPAAPGGWRFGRPAVAFDGRRFLVAATTQRGTESVVRGVTLGLDGAVWDSAPFELGPTTAGQVPGVAGSSAHNAFLVAYDTRVEGSRRVRARVVTENEVGSPCAVGAACPSGFCVDGVCCESACGGGAADDCFACAHALTGSPDGTCAPRSVGSACGDDSDGTCSAPDTCDASGVCRPNHAPAGAACGVQGVSCRVDDSCDGNGSCVDGGLAAEGTACGDSQDTECSAPDTCDATGVCQPNHRSGPCGDLGVECHRDDVCSNGVCIDRGVDEGAPCGDRRNFTCSAPDTCDAAGVCQPNDAPAGRICRYHHGTCRQPERCDGSGGCVDGGVLPAGSACGNSDSSECSAPDSCDDSGVCQRNDLAAGAPCRDPGIDCRIDYACNGSGSCVHGGFAEPGTACGDASETPCSAADTCDASGTCVPNHTAAGTACGDVGVDCRLTDTCNGLGTCVDQGLASAGTACGDHEDRPCSRPDTCDASGTCLPNHAVPGAACGDQGVACHIDDQCDGAGTCTDNGLLAEGTACGDRVDSDCTNPDTCDAIGVCQPHHAPDGSPCTTGTFCASGDTCLAGTCEEGTRSPCGAGTTCVESDNLCVLSCGDGTVQEGEQCDDGPSNSDALADACRTDCTRARCGDGVVDTGEACDDGGDNSDTQADACRTSCVEAFCGDGVVDTDEVCDDPTCDPVCSGQADAGVPDGGAAPDGSVEPDAGRRDAGPPDAAVPSDADIVLDAASRLDGSAPDASTMPGTAAGCGCRAAPSSPRPLLALLLVGLVGLIVRRRRQR